MKLDQDNFIVCRTTLVDEGAPQHLSTVVSVLHMPTLRYGAFEINFYDGAFVNIKVLGAANAESVQAFYDENEALISTNPDRIDAECRANLSGREALNSLVLFFDKKANVPYGEWKGILNGIYNLAG